MITRETKLSDVAALIIVNFINDKKFTISTALVSLARAEAFQSKNQALWAYDRYKEFSVPLVIFHCPEQHIITVQRIKGIKFSPKVIGDVWHNGEGSTGHKSRRIGLTSADTLGNLFLKTGFNDRCSIRVIDCSIRVFRF